MWVTPRSCFKLKIIDPELSIFQRQEKEAFRSASKT